MKYKRRLLKIHDHEPQSQIRKIKDLSKLKCHKEMKETWFSIDFIVFSSWLYYKEGFMS